MEELLVGLLGALLETLAEFVLEVIFELAAEALSGLIDFPEWTSPAASALWLAFVGAAAGLLSSALFPHRLIGMSVALPGISLLFAPLAAGFAMHQVGKRLRNVGRHASELATFRGGALFALAMALVRWWIVGFPH